MGEIRRIQPDVIGSLFGLFEARQYHALPRFTALVDDAEFKLLMDRHGLSRSQIQYQFVRWREGEKPPSSAAAAPCRVEKIGAVVRSLVSSSDDIVLAAAKACENGSVIQLRPWLLPVVSIFLSGEGLLDVKQRVEELTGLVISCYSDTRSSAQSIHFECALNNTRRAFIRLVTSREYFNCAFANELPGDFKEGEITVTKALLLDSLDRHITSNFRKQFSPAACSVGIPPFDVDNPPYNDLVLQTLYYIAGYLCSALYAEARRGHPLSAHLTTFVAVHNISIADADAMKLPTSLVRLRSKGSLICSSKCMYELVLLLENGCSSQLTLPHVVARGGAIMSDTLKLMKQNYQISQAFSACVSKIFEGAKAAGLTQVNGSDLFDLILAKFMNLRGRDVVRTIMSKLRLKQSAAVANCHRGALAGIATLASKKAKNDPKKPKIVNDSKRNEAFEVTVTEFDKDQPASGDGGYTEADASYISAHLDGDTRDAMDFEMEEVIGLCSPEEDTDEGSLGESDIAFWGF